MPADKPRRPLLKALLLLALILLVAPFLLWKRRAPAPTSAPDAPAEHRSAALRPAFDPAAPVGGLEGLVRDADGAPVDGAVVTVVRNPSRAEGPNFARPVPRAAVTARGGRFQLPDVPPGDYGVTATAALGAPASRPHVEVLSGKRTEVILTLGRGGALFTGEVYDVGGGTVAGAKAQVRIFDVFRVGQPDEWFEVTGNDKGVFKIRLAPGDYEIIVRADGYSSTRDRFALSTTAQTRRYRLKPSARLAGRVVDRRTRERVPGAKVWLRLDRMQAFVDQETTSNSAGEFSFDDLTPASYVVSARARALVGLSPLISVGVAEAVTDVEVLVEPGRAIRGTVLGSDGKGLPGATVSAIRATPPFERGALVQSGSGGVFAIEGLLPAKYRVAGWLDGKGRSNPETVQVTTSDVEGLRVQLAADTIVRGKVVDATGTPVAGVDVSAGVQVRGPERQQMLDNATTDAEGKFALSRLGPGTLVVTARHPERGTGKWGPGETPAETAPITVKLEAVGTISGLVKYEDGSPASQVVVFAAPMPMGPLFAAPEHGTTDEGGRYRVAGLPGGGYLVIARDNSERDPRSRQTVTLASGQERSGVDLVLPTRRKRITGRVLAPDGEGVSGAVVSAGLEQEGFAVRRREGIAAGSIQATSEQDGAFTLEELQDGRYSLWAVDTTHADGELKGVAAGSSNVIIRLKAGASVAGVVVTSDGKPVSDYAITALPGDWPGASPTERMRTEVTSATWSASLQVHDPSGAFSIGRLAPGAYQLTVTTADNQPGLLPVSVAAGEKKTGLGVVVETAGTELGGRVVDADRGTPIPGVSVVLASGATHLTATTSGEGTFSLKGVSPGRARIDFRPDNGAPYVPEYTDIVVDRGQTSTNVGVIRMLQGSWSERAGGPGGRGRIGFTVSLLEGRPSVTDVLPGFPGAKAGLQPGDLVLAIDGRAVAGLGNGALDFLAAGPMDRPLTVNVQSRQGGGARDVSIQRVPMDYDPNRTSGVSTR